MRIANYESDAKTLALPEQLAQNETTHDVEISRRFWV